MPSRPSERPGTGDSVTAEGSYYWAGGERISLGSSNEFVIDLESAAHGGLDEAALTLLATVGKPLKDRLILVRDDAVPAALGRRLGTVQGVHPVFRADDGTLIAVLPEVRVEDSDAGALTQVEGFLADDLGAVVSKQRTGRLTVQLASGRGSDALTLANKLTEDLHPQLAQARFLRVMQRPDTP